jgi:pimeloyl-ACP methyl ester carboxylesterase
LFSTQPQRIPVAGIELEVQSWGAGEETILLLHEGLGSVAHWRDFPHALSEATGRQVVAWSRQGHGRSQKLSRPRNPDYMHVEADRLPLLMDTLNLERAHLFGHSDGASIALIAASRVPERVTSLVLEAPHVLVEQITYDSIAKAKDLYRSTDLPARLGRYHADVHHTFWSWNDVWLDPRFRDWNIENVLPGIRAPALLIQGVDDEYGTLDQLKRIAAVLPETRLLVLEHCGHAPHRDRPEMVLTETREFLKEQARRTMNPGE